MHFECQTVACNIMPRQADISNVEKHFILEAVLQNLRLDGRRPDQFRPIDIAFGEQYGTATVTLGKTRYDWWPARSRMLTMT